MRVWTNRDIETHLLKLLPDTIAAGSLNEPGSRVWFFSANPDKTSGIDRDMGMEISEWDASNPTINFRLFTADDDRGKWGKSFELPCDPTAEEIDGVDWNAIAEYIKGYILDGKNESNNPNKREESMLSIKTHNKFESKVARATQRTPFRSKVESKQATAPAPKKNEATKFGSGMAKRTDFSKTKNLGELFDVLEEHHKLLKAATQDINKSKKDLEEAIKRLNEFEGYTDFLKTQSVKGIKKALTLKNSPEVQAAGEVEKVLKDALSIVVSDYKNIPDVKQLMVVIDSRYATRGSKILTTMEGQVSRAIDVDMQTIKNSIERGDVSEEDVMQFVSLTTISHGVKDKSVSTTLKPILERMNAMIAASEKLENAVIDPQQFADLRNLVEQIVNEASAPKDTLRTAISALDKEKIASVPESKVSEGLLDKLKALIASIKEKIAGLWDSFTALFFSIEDDALESADVFDEVELGLALVGVEVYESKKKRANLGKKFEVLTKAVLHCCDNLVKDTSLAGEFDDEVIYAEDAVKNAVESMQTLGEACKSLKNIVSCHKNEDNMSVIGILSDAISQIVADEEGDAADAEGEEAEDNEDSVIDQVEREYSGDEGGAEGGAEGGEELTSDGEPGEAPNPMGMPEPEL